MSYTIIIDNYYIKEKTKDDVIAHLMTIINGDGTMPISVIWPDGSLIEMEGED